MDWGIFIPGDFSRYVTHFNRSEYAGLFADYRQRCAPCLEAVEAERADEAAAELVEYGESLVRPWIKKRVLFDIKCLFTLYTIPAALDSGEAGRAFAAALVACWNSRRPKDCIQAASSAELMKGFEDTGIFGFKKF